MQMQPLYCDPIYCGAQQGFVNNEFWVYAHNVANCPSGTCWIEVGHGTFSGAFNCVVHTSCDEFFWADERPKLGYSEHVFNPLQQGDYNCNATFSITQIGGLRSGNFSVQIVPCKSPQIKGTSTANGIAVDDINVGMDLHGTSGATAGYDYFTYNRWVDTNNSVHYQAVNGNGLYDPITPPYIACSPCARDSSTGGTYYTHL